jgi:cytidine deaminase
VDQDREADDDAVKFEAFVGIAPSRFLEFFEIVERKDSMGYSLNESAPAHGPKGVTSGSLVADLESEYLRSIDTAVWSKLREKDAEK